jgi:hypothetical protein
MIELIADCRVRKRRADLLQTVVQRDGNLISVRL